MIISNPFRQFSRYPVVCTSVVSDDVAKNQGDARVVIRVEERTENPFASDMPIMTSCA